MAEAPTPRRFPLLWQLNARTAVRSLGADATLDALDDAVLDRLLPPGVDWLYLLGVWQTGAAGRQVSQDDTEIRRSCEEALPDLTLDEICGSCFAITGYRVHEHLGGDGALARLRHRLAERSKLVRGNRVQHQSSSVWKRCSGSSACFTATSMGNFLRPPIHNGASPRKARPLKFAGISAALANDE